MSTFDTDEQAWSAWTKTIEKFSGDPGIPLIVQSSPVLRPLSVRDVDKRLAWFRKLLIGDSIPIYAKKNPLNYVATGESLGTAYQQYLTELNNEVIKRFPNEIDQKKLAAALVKYDAAQKKLTTWVKEARIDWAKKKKANPNLTRAEWDADYKDSGYTPKLKFLQRESAGAYGKYKSLAAPFPEVERVAMALAATDGSANAMIRLPQDSDELELGEEAWDPFFKTNLDIDFDDFFKSDNNLQLGVDQSSQQSSYYDHRWSAGGSVGYGFFKIGADASGGTVEQHLRAGTQKVRFGFKKIISSQVTRGRWYDEGLVTTLPYVSYVDFEDYWGPQGAIRLIPTGVILARGISVEIETSQVAYDSYHSWQQQNVGASVSWGPWSIGGSASSSTSWGSVSDTSSGSTIRYTDNSDRVYVIAVISRKMDDSVQAAYLQVADADFLRLSRESESFGNGDDTAEV